MSSKTKPNIEAQAVILREAGYTCPAIAAQLDLSLSTTKRILKRRGVVAGAATTTLIEQARQNMLNTVYELETVRKVQRIRLYPSIVMSQKKLPLVTSCKSYWMTAATSRRSAVKAKAMRTIRTTSTVLP